jgi:hypothetical protein
VGNDPQVQFDESGAGAAEAPIVISQLAKVSAFAWGQGAETSFAVFGPRDHG